MGPRILGIDLTDNGASAALSDTEETFHFPTAVCRDRKHDRWYIGEEAYEQALSGKGILTDKLLRLAERGGTATVRGVRYEAKDLLGQFAQEVRGITVERTGGAAPSASVIVLEDYERAKAAALTESLASYGFPKGETFVISRAESFLYYVMSQPREVRTGQVGLFDLSDQSLSFYELRTRRDRNRLIVYAEQEKLDEAFTLTVLETESGEKLADNIMTSCAERLMKRKIFSAVFLTGKGFERYDWADSFMKAICQRRKVFIDQDLFAKGALVRGALLSEGRGDPGFTAICSGRAGATVTMNVEKNGHSMVFPVVTAGDPLSGAGVSLRLMPDSMTELELRIDPLNPKKVKSVRLPLSFLPQRPPKASFIDFLASFPDEQTMQVKLKDAGFGELFPKTDAFVEREVRLWE